MLYISDNVECIYEQDTYHRVSAIVPIFVSGIFINFIILLINDDHLFTVVSFFISIYLKFLKELVQ